MPIDPGTAILAGAGISTLGGLIGGGRSGKKTDQTAAAMLAIAELQQRFAEEERDFMRGTTGGARQQLMNYLEMPAEERALPTLRSGSSALAEAYRAEQDALARTANQGGLRGSGQLGLAQAELADRFARARADVYSQGLQRARFTEPLAAMGLYRGIDPGQTLQASAQTLGQLGQMYAGQQQSYLEAIGQGLSGLGYWGAMNAGRQPTTTTAGGGGGGLSANPYNYFAPTNYSYSPGASTFGSSGIDYSRPQTYASQYSLLNSGGRYSSLPSGGLGAYNPSSYSFGGLDLGFGY